MSKVHRNGNGQIKRHERSQKHVKRLRKLALEGATVTAIAEDLGLSVRHVYTIWPADLRLPQERLTEINERERQEIIDLRNDLMGHEEIAKRVGVTRHQVRKALRGHTVTPSVQAVSRIMALVKSLPRAGVVNRVANRLNMPAILVKKVLDEAR